ncbi:UNVERIFIED_CONTAM: hypothetical protein K2H54_017970 [Gekko kuhli]
MGQFAAPTALSYINIWSHGAGGHDYKYNTPYRRQQHSAYHHGVGFGQKEQKHEHAFPSGGCPQRTDHAPGARLFPAARYRSREL